MFNIDVDSEVPETNAETEHQHHHYSSNVIPWYVRLIWIGFWIFAIYYAIANMFPAIQVELFQAF